MNHEQSEAMNSKVITRKLSDMTPEEQRHMDHVCNQAAEKAKWAREEKEAWQRSFERRKMKKVPPFLGFYLFGSYEDLLLLPEQITVAHNELKIWPTLRF